MKRTHAQAKPAPASAVPSVIEPLQAFEVPIGQLREDPKNVRRHDARNLAAIAASLSRFGQQAPVLFVRRGKSRIVVKGNGVLAAARRLGWKRLAAVESGLAESEALAFAIADNRATDLSAFDAELLAAQLQELEESEFDIASIGFTDEELQDLVESVEEPPVAADRDDVTGERKKGAHRIGFTLGQFHFEVARQAYDAWLTAVESKCGPDADQVIKEIRRRLKLA